jgi:hypothetical protein
MTSTAFHPGLILVPLVPLVRMVSWARCWANNDPVWAGVAAAPETTADVVKVLGLASIPGVVLRRRLLAPTAAVGAGGTAKVFPATCHDLQV